MCFSVIETQLNCKNNMGNKETTKTTKDAAGTEQHKSSFFATVRARTRESKEPLEEMSGWLMCDLAGVSTFPYIPQVLDLNPMGSWHTWQRSKVMASPAVATVCR